MCHNFAKWAFCCTFAVFAVAWHQDSLQARIQHVSNSNHIMKEIEPIAFFKCPFKEKFGVPRQSGVVEELRGQIVFEPKYAVPEALRGLEGFDYVWLVWGFHKAVREGHATVAEFKPTVRPPRLGGNTRLGVFATRSPFRPNGLGLSSVRLGKIEVGCIEVFGADLMDGTPIYDVKPYLPYVDSHPEARGGFTEKAWKPLEVIVPEKWASCFSAGELSVLCKVLAQDPRPHYQADATRVYGMMFGTWNIKFVVDGQRLIVIGV